MFFECYINGSQVIVDTQKQVITNPLIPNDNRLVSLFVMDIQLLSMVWKTIMEDFGKWRKEGRTLTMFLSYVIATTLLEFYNATLDTTTYDTKLLIATVWVCQRRLMKLSPIMKVDELSPNEKRDLQLVQYFPKPTMYTKRKQPKLSKKKRKKMRKQRKKEKDIVAPIHQPSKINRGIEKKWSVNMLVNKTVGFKIVM